MAIYSKVYRVSWVETDAARVVHCSNYFRYCERVEEEELLNEMGLDFQEIAKRYKLWLPRVSASCQFRWPLRFNQRFRVDLEDAVVGDKSIKYKYKIWNLDEDRLSAECELVIVCTRIKKGRAVPLPGELKGLLIEKIESCKRRGIENEGVRGEL